MSMKTEDYEEFQRQLALANSTETKQEVKTKKDDDGTEYEWDETKKAWFPKLSVDLMMKYQSNYVDQNENASDQTAHSQSSKATYLDPQTKIKYIWDDALHQWKPETKHFNYPHNYKYTDPTTGRNYAWDSEGQTWIVVESNTENNDDKHNSGVVNASTEEKKVPATTSGNECSQTADATSEGSSVNVYVHPETGAMYKWDVAKQVWETDDGQVLHPSMNWSSSQTYTDEQTGKVFTWDHNTQAWKETTTKPNEVKKGKKAKIKSTAVKRAASKPEWFEIEGKKNTNVYVSGLPPDITQIEFHELMLKCGIITPNPVNGEPKMKLYSDKAGNFKGDGLCCYLKKESVPLAIQILDGTVIRGYTINVQEAQFELKGNYDASKKPKMMSKKDKKKLHKEQEKLLDWKLARAEENVSKTERVLILKNMFDTKDFEEDPVQITDIRDDLRKECEKFGHVKKVIVFDRHPDGVCSVAFKEVEDAKKCQMALNGRWFAYKTVEASIWDGVTDYQIEETDKEREVRLKKWEEYLTDEKKDSAANDATDSTEVTGEPSTCDTISDKDLQPADDEETTDSKD